MIGPALGGGFGRYMGYFGLVLDNIIDMTVVLANGDIKQVSATSNPDLYWGMKGAGMNFGIVTQANFKIYDFPTTTGCMPNLSMPTPSIGSMLISKQSTRSMLIARSRRSWVLCTRCMPLIRNIAALM